MRKLFILVPFIFGIMSACSKSVPDVPDVQDPHNIVVDGKKMLQKDFLEKYCVVKPTYPTCLKVNHAKIQDETKGEVPRF